MVQILMVKLLIMNTLEHTSTFKEKNKEKAKEI